MARLVALVAAAVLVLSGCGGGSSSTPAADPAPQVVPGHFGCPEPTAAPETVVDDGSDALPSGASAARLCYRDNNAAWILPHGALTSGLDDLVAVVNRQRVHDPDSDDGCGGVGAPAWFLVLRYDGGTRTIAGDNGGCWDLRVGSTERFGSRAVYDAYWDAVLDQRRREAAPHTSYPVPACPHRVGTDDSFSPVSDAARLTAARACPRAGRAPALKPAQLQALRHDVATAAPQRQVRDLGGPCLQQGRQLEGAVVGVDAWGDPVTLLVECDWYRVLRPGTDRYLFVRMLPSTERMLRHALAG